MSLITLLVALIVIGLVWYLVNQLPLPAPVKTIITVVFIIILIFMVLNLFYPVGGIRIGR